MILVDLVDYGTSIKYTILKVIFKKYFSKHARIREARFNILCQLFPNVHAKQHFALLIAILAQADLPTK